MNTDAHMSRIYFPSHTSKVGYHGKCMVQLRDTPYSHTDTKQKKISTNAAMALEMYMMMDIIEFKNNKEFQLQFTPECQLCKKALCEVPE